MTRAGIMALVIRVKQSQAAGVAQLVEQLICNQPVASSSLVTSFQKVNDFKGFVPINGLKPLL